MQYNLLAAPGDVGVHHLMGWGCRWWDEWRGAMVDRAELQATDSYAISSAEFFIHQCIPVSDTKGGTESSRTNLPKGI